MMIDDTKRRLGIPEEHTDEEGDPKQPGPAKKVGDPTPNPLPDDPSEDDHGGSGDPGRS